MRINRLAAHFIYYTQCPNTDEICKLNKDGCYGIDKKTGNKAVVYVYHHNSEAHKA
jgi:hypothetical protein